MSGVVLNTRNHVSQDRAGMSRTHLTLDVSFRHTNALSVIVLKVYLACFAVRKSNVRRQFLLTFTDHVPARSRFSSCKPKYGKEMSYRVAAESITSSRSRRRPDCPGGIPRLLLVSKNSRKPLCLNELIISDHPSPRSKVPESPDQSSSGSRR